MNLSQLSVKELISLIQDASAELASRANEPQVDRIKAERPVVVLREPPDDDKEFVLALKTRVMKGGYATAEERNRIADLAVEYKAWIERQRMPTERGTWGWRKLAEQSRIKPARER